MEIYVFRHGIAEESRAGQDDSERRLTPDGRQKLRRILTLARAAGVEPEVILSSPYRRARETAAVAVEVLKLKTEILESPSLTPMEPPENAWREIREHQDAQQLMVVGHEPHLSGFICYLIGARAGALDFKKGAIARVDVESLGPRPNGALVWLLTARLAGA